MVTLTVDAAIEKLGFGKCQKLYIASSAMIFFIELMSLVTDGILLPTIKCEFDLEQRGASIYLLLSRITFFMGGILGGRLGDRIGRRKSIMLGLMFQVIVINITVQMYSAVLYTIFHSFTKIAFGIVMPSAYSLTIELCPAAKRHFVKICFGLAGTTGGFTGAYIGRFYTVYSWRIILGFVSWLCLLPMISTYLLYESPRFYAVHDKVDQARLILSKVLIWNDIKMPSIWNLRKDSIIEDCGSYRDLFRHGLSRISMKLIYVMMIKGIFITTLYMSLQYIFGKKDANASQSCQHSLSRNFAEIALAFIPDFVIMPSALHFAQTKGRRISISTCFLTSSFFLFLSSFIPASPMFSIIFGVGVSATAAARSVLVLYTSELYPTTLRSVANGLIWSSDTLGSILAPFLTEYIVVSHARPFMAVAACFVFTCVFVVRSIRRETLNQPLSASVQDLIKNSGESV